MKIQDSYPISHMHQCFDAPGDATILSTGAPNRGYCIVQIVEGEGFITAIMSHKSMVLFTSIVLGLKNAPGTFQRSMYDLFRNINLQLGVSNLVDIGILL